jgi:hypothetical protein
LLLLLLIPVLLQPLVPPTGLLIFKDITFRGFWVSGG